MFQSLIGFYGFSGALTWDDLTAGEVSIPDRVLWVFRRFHILNKCDSIDRVSIPDRVLWVFRLWISESYLSSVCVSIPDRVLWVFRLGDNLAVKIKLLFQSLIGFYGFSGLKRVAWIQQAKVSIPDRVLWVFRPKPTLKLGRKLISFNP